MEAKNKNINLRITSSIIKMERYTPVEISSLQLTPKEAKHPSRSRLGIHVFISRFFFEYATLTDEQKLALFDRQPDSDADSVDSLPMPKVYEVFQLATREWRSLSRRTKDAWKLRATELNRRPVPGRFSFVPLDLEEPDLNSNIRKMLELSWNKFRRSIYPCVTRKPRGGISKKTYQFGSEHVELGTQKYKEIEVNLLLRLSLFGHKFNKLKEREVIRSYPKSTLLHFMSQERVRYVFTLAGLCNMEFEHKVSNNLHTCCAKVNTKSKDTGTDMIGFIVRETQNDWQIHLANNTVVTLKRGVYNAQSGTYIFPDSNVYTRQITHIWPVRMLVFESGDYIKMSLCRFCLDQNNTIVPQHCS